MKKTLCGLLVVLLVIAMAGCGGSSGGSGGGSTGMTMTNEEATEKFVTASETITAVMAGIDYIGDNSYTPDYGSMSSTKASSGFKMMKAPTWTRESGGWYKATDEYFGNTRTIWVRYLEKSQTIQCKGSFIIPEEYTEEGVGAVTVSMESSLSQGSNGKWNGNLNTTMTMASGTIKTEIVFANVDTVNGCGTYKMWATITGTKPMSRTQVLDLTVTYDSSGGETPIRLNGWYIDDDGNKQEIKDGRVAIFH